MVKMFVDLTGLHQFDKVEIVHIEHPDRSDETLDEMVSYVASLVESLELPYRILYLCAGDTGLPLPAPLISRSAAAQKSGWK